MLYLTQRMRPLFCSLVLLANIATGCDTDPPERPAAESRPFLMGFTCWPADLTQEGVDAANRFAVAHGDIVSVMFIGGIPWPEALAGKPFSEDVRSAMALALPPGKRLLLSISPLNMERSGLALYWGKADNQPLPQEWRELPLDSPQVRQAYLAFVLQAVAEMKPDYLAIGVESNVLLSKSAQKWTQFKTLYRETYSAVKRKHPDLPVFFSTDVLHYLKLASDARDTDQQAEVMDLMRHSDLFAMSLYPHMSHEVPRPLPSDLLDFAPRFGKPVVVAESGMTSRDVELKSFGLTLHGSEADQKQYLELLLQTAQRDDYAFVINFATTDFERLCDRLSPPLDDIGRIFCYTGMQTSDLRPKPALAVWERYRTMSYRPRP